MTLNNTTGKSGTAFSSVSNETLPSHRMRIRYQHVSRIEDGGNRKGAGRLATHPLLAGLLLLTALTSSPLRAQTNTVEGTPLAQRWLLIVETSRSMQRRSEAVFQTVQDLLTSGMAGQLRPGDTLGVWTFSDDLYAGRFALQTWSPEAQQDIASSALTFLKGQKYGKQANFDKVLPALNQVIKDSRLLTVVLVSSGDQKMRGTLFDAQINEFWQKWHTPQQKARMPFVTVLRAKAGQLAEYALNTPPWPTQMPHLSQETQSAEAISQKPLEAPHNPAPHAVPPLIISGKKPLPEKAPPPKPAPTVVKTNAPALVAAAPSTNNLRAANPPTPVVPPVQTAKTEPAPVAPAKPSAEVAPKPLPTPVLATPPKMDAVKGPETKPAEPAPGKPEVAATVQTLPAKPKPVVIELPKTALALEPKPAPALAPALPAPATQQVSASALRPRPSAPAPSPSATASPPAQTAAAVPAETLAGHKSIWIAALAFAGIAAGFAVLLLRRSRATPQASLITRSFERKNRP